MLWLLSDFSKLFLLHEYFGMIEIQGNPPQRHFFSLVSKTIQTSPVKHTLMLIVKLVLIKMWVVSEQLDRTDSF